MSDRERISGAKKILTRAAALVSSLTGYPLGRLDGSHGRRVRAILTAALVLTGVSAWALALVQPWTSRGANVAMMTLPGGVDAERLRSASVDLEKQISENAAPQASYRELSRSPFGPASAGAAEFPAAAPTSSGHSSTGSENPVATAPAAAPTTKQTLEEARGLRLEVILTTPSGERWVVINGTSYREGDAVAGMEIVEIQETRIKLQRAGTTCLLRMD
jgi:Type II secretion system protein B